MTLQQSESILHSLCTLSQLYPLTKPEQGGFHYNIQLTLHHLHDLYTHNYTCVDVYEREEYEPLSQAVKYFSSPTTRTLQGDLQHYNTLLDLIRKLTPYSPPLCTQ